MASEKVLTITETNFESVVGASPIPVLVDFWATWCGPCRAIAPTIDALADEFDTRVAVGKINVDEQNALAGQFKVMSIPTLGLFKNGQLVEKKVGAKTKTELIEWLESHI